MEKKLAREDVKATLGDYIRLVQLQKELEEEEPGDQGDMGGADEIEKHPKEESDGGT